MNDIQQYYAQIDKETLLVSQVILAPSLEWVNENLPGLWVDATPTDTSPLPGIGWQYSVEYQRILTPQPYQSWTLDDNGDWQPPVPFPGYDKDYSYDWSEVDGDWIAREVGDR